LRCRLEPARERADGPWPHYRVVVDEAGKALQDVYVTAHGVEQAQLMKTDPSGEFSCTISSQVATC